MTSNSFFKRSYLVFQILFWSATSSWAEAQNLGLSRDLSTEIESAKSGIYSQGLKKTQLAEALKNIHPGQVIVLGEQHGTQVQAQQQLDILKELKKMGLRVSVGMEFFDFNQQSFVDSYRQGVISEEDFLKSIQWGQGFPFSAYRSQVQFPQAPLESVVALNAPRSITGKISKLGWEGLTNEERNQLPQDLSLGNSLYFERFKLVMGSHVPESAILRYFQAQSTWDATMAWKADDFIKTHPDQVLVIIVGEFHVQYGGGLPDRLRQRGLSVTTFSLVNIEGLTDIEVDVELQPHSSYGSRADYVWAEKIPATQ